MDLLQFVVGRFCFTISWTMMASATFSDQRNTETGIRVGAGLFLLSSMVASLNN